MHVYCEEEISAEQFLKYVNGFEAGAYRSIWEATYWEASYAHIEQESRYDINMFEIRVHYSDDGDDIEDEDEHFGPINREERFTRNIRPMDGRKRIEHRGLRASSRRMLTRTTNLHFHLMIGQSGGCAIVIIRPIAQRMTTMRTPLRL